MRLKEIKPGMAIYCKDNEEKKALLEEAERLGYLWYESKQKPTEKLILSIGNTIHFYDAGKSCFSADYKHITHSGRVGRGITEFSDLILPELTVEEVLKIRNELDAAFVRDYLGIFCEMSLDKMLRTATPEQIIDMCHQWKATHEKKEPEVEWFWQGRIYEVGNNGQFYQIKDGKGFYDTGCECRESAEEYMADELKEYCKTHEGDYIAVVEHVCRVKK